MMVSAEAFARIVGKHTKQGFPYFNVVADQESNPNHVRIDMAVAGFKKEEISIKIKQLNLERVLLIEGKRCPTDASSIYKHFFAKGIMGSSFSRQFFINPNQHVRGSCLEDGILSVFIENVYPRDNEITIQID